MANNPRAARLKRCLAGRCRRFTNSRRRGPLVAIGRRFIEIDGFTYGGLLAIELFTTVLPLMILGYSYLSGFADNVSVGTVLVRQFGLDASSAEIVRAAFGSSSGLRSTWTVVGILGFAVWGIPMSMTVAAMFARAWRRTQLDFGARLWRGLVWFLLYLVLIAVRERIANVSHPDWYARAPMFLVSLIPTWAFWSLSPSLLIRNGGQGRRSLALAGLGGMIIDGLILSIAVHIVFPELLAGWVQFGPIGVTMALMTWAGVIGTSWVVAACAGAVIWERTAPVATGHGADHQGNGTFGPSTPATMIDGSRC